MYLSGNLELVYVVAIHPHRKNGGGFLAVDSFARDVIDRVVVDQIVLSDLQYDIVQQTLDNYIIILARVRAILILAGIASGRQK